MAQKAKALICDDPTFSGTCDAVKKLCWYIVGNGTPGLLTTTQEQAKEIQEIKMELVDLPNIRSAIKELTGALDKAKGFLYAQGLLTAIATVLVIIDRLRK